MPGICLEATSSCAAVQGSLCHYQDALVTLVLCEQHPQLDLHGHSLGNREKKMILICFLTASHVQPDMQGTGTKTQLLRLYGEESSNRHG